MVLYHVSILETTCKMISHFQARHLHNTYLMLTYKPFLLGVELRETENGENMFTVWCGVSATSDVLSS